MAGEHPAFQGDDPLQRVACMKCGYRLRGLDPEGDCPECGQSIRASESLSLVNADQRWLIDVCTGLRLLGRAVLAFVGLLLVLMAMILSDRYGISPSNELTGLLIVGFLLGLLAMLGFMWRGTWKLASEPPPSQAWTEQTLCKNLRRSFGWAALGGACIAPIGWVCWPWYYYSLGTYCGELGKQAGVPKLGERIKWAGYTAAAGYIGYTAMGFVAINLPPPSQQLVPVLFLLPLFGGLLALGVFLLKLLKQIERTFLLTRQLLD